MSSQPAATLTSPRPVVGTLLCLALLISSLPAPAQTADPNPPQRAPEWDIVKELPIRQPTLSSQEVRRVSQLARADSLAPEDKALIRRYVNQLIAESTQQANLDRIPELFEPLLRLRRPAQPRSRNGTTEEFQEVVGEAILANLDQVMENNLRVRINVLILAHAFPARDMAPYMIRLLGQRDLLEPIQYMAIKVLGRVAQRRMGVREENAILDVLLRLYRGNDPLNPLIRNQVLSAFGYVGRPDATGTDYSRQHPERVDFAIGRLLCDAATNADYALSTRVIACESLSRLRQIAIVAPPLRPIVRAFAQTSLAITNEMMTELDRLEAIRQQSGLTDLEREAEQGKRRGRRMELLVLGYRLGQAIDRLKDQWRRSESSLERLHGIIKSGLGAWGKAYVEPAQSEADLDRLKADLETWLQENPES